MNLPFKIDEKITPKVAFSRGATNVYVYRNGKRISKLKTPRGKNAIMKGKVWSFGYDPRTMEIDVDIDLPKSRQLAKKK
jgi:hypothetical protein